MIQLCSCVFLLHVKPCQVGERRGAPGDQIYVSMFWGVENGVDVFLVESPVK